MLLRLTEHSPAPTWPTPPRRPSRPESPTRCRSSPSPPTPGARGRRGCPPPPTAARLREGKGKAEGQQDRARWTECRWTEGKRRGRQRDRRGTSRSTNGSEGKGGGQMGRGVECRKEKTCLLKAEKLRTAGIRSRSCSVSLGSARQQTTPQTQCYAMHSPVMKANISTPADHTSASSAS